LVQGAAGLVVVGGAGSRPPVRSAKPGAAPGSRSAGVAQQEIARYEEPSDVERTWGSSSEDDAVHSLARWLHRGTPPPPLRSRQGRPGARGPCARGRPAGARGLAQSASPRAPSRPARRASAVRAPRPPRRRGASPLSAVAVHRLVRRSCVAGGVLERLAHPHALRAYGATHLLEAGVPVHEVSAQLGHVTCARPRATLRPGPSGWRRLPRSSTAGTRRRGGRVGKRRPNLVG
jgi:Phage integrase family